MLQVFSKVFLFSSTLMILLISGLHAQQAYKMSSRLGIIIPKPLVKIMTFHLFFVFTLLLVLSLLFLL
ncbi:MAG: hypothetical protein ACM3IJ_02070 [Candidatus Levyibacteriota bacterium]